MLREASGEERILYDCSSQSSMEAACGAMDPAVSFDGRTVAFSVFRGTLQYKSDIFDPKVFDPEAAPGELQYVVFPNRALTTHEAQLYLLEVASGELRALPHVPGTYDTGPAFLPNGRLAFTSTRDGHRATGVIGATSTPLGTRTWSMDLDGRNIDLSSHHSLAQEQHPYVLRDGRVLLSSWQLFGGLPFRHTNGSTGGFTTLANLFHLFVQHPDGAEPFAFFGQHAGDHVNISSVGVDHKAAHFVTQTSDGRVWFADYYRGNNDGLGEVLGMMPEPVGQEGIGPAEATSVGDVFAPRDLVRFARWTTSGDEMSRRMPEPELRVPTYADPLLFAGKVGHPAALPEGGLMVVWGKGPCGRVTSNDVFGWLGRERPALTSGSGVGTPVNLMTWLGMDTPGCDTGIYRATRIPSMHPSDLELIVDSRDWHEIQPRALVPYAAIHGVERPTVIERADLRTQHHALEVGTPFGLLGSASIIDRETRPRGGIVFQGETQFHGQGTDTIEYDDDDLCGVRILGIMPNRGSEAWRDVAANPAGERVRILGEFPVRNRHSDGTPRMDPSGHPDTSFLVRFPANMPYLMQAIDCDGHTLNTDQTWQSLRPGEQKTCGGCHVHSRPTRVSFEESFAATRDYTVFRLGEGTVPLLAGRDSDGAVRTRSKPGYGLALDFERDVMPIFEQRCVSCHSSSSPAAGLALDRPGTESGSTWNCLVTNRGQTCVPEERRHPTGSGTTFRRPQLTRYVRAFNSLASLLYWKAAGRRTDKRTDESFGDEDPIAHRDIDFGPAHPTSVTPEELGIIGRWIDIGSPAGELKAGDTQRPTLHLAATVLAEAITELHVGTVDLGHGIDTESLEVCVLEGQECGQRFSVSARPHGIAHIELTSSLTDPDLVIRARVLDLAGNETVIERTVSWLLNAPPPVPPEDSDSGVAPMAEMAEDGSITGGCGCRTSSGGSWGMTALVVLWLLRRRRGLRQYLGGR